jgi:hypothetical protein
VLRGEKPRRRGDNPRVAGTNMTRVSADCAIFRVLSAPTFPLFPLFDLLVLFSAPTDSVSHFFLMLPGICKVLSSPAIELLTLRRCLPHVWGSPLHSQLSRATSRFALLEVVMPVWSRQVVTFSALPECKVNRCSCMYLDLNKLNNICCCNHTSK